MDRGNLYYARNFDKNSVMSRIILITGATAGFGEAMARKFAASGDALILTGRRQERLDQLKSELEKKHSTRVKTLAFDIRSRSAVEQAISSLGADWSEIDVLINNAGLALGAAPIDQGEIDDWEQMIDTNIKGVLYISRAVIPAMKVRGRGHIIHLGSVAAKVTYKNGNVYCATKRAIESLSEGMRLDLLPYGIKVTAIHPGAAETEFSQVRFKGDLNRAASVYQGYQPLTAQDVADVTFFCASLPAHVCVNDLVLTCTAQADTVHFHKT